MLRAGRVIHALVLVLGFGSWGQAAPAGAESLRLYSGSLSLHYFANDTSTGSTSPFDARVFVALPLGAHCNPAVSGGKACDPSATLQVGVPLTGSGSALVGSSSPASIMLPPYQLARITSGSLPPRYASQLYQKTYANLANAAANFRAGSGPGAVDSVFGPETRVRISPGKNQFGGLMNLLAGTPSGALGTKGKYSVSGYGYLLNFPTWGVIAFGATSNPYAYPVQLQGTSSSTMGGSVLTITGTARGWRWTTGMVSVSAAGDYALYSSEFPERLVRTGYDNRTAGGGGTIQLVTPHLTSWGAPPDINTGEIGVLRLQFVPEPSGLLLLLAGAGMLLGLMYRRSTA